MSEKPLDQRNLPEQHEPEIIVNEYGDTRDPAVVVDEADRTVLLTNDETIVIDKEPRIDVVPTNRPRKVYGGMWGQAELITMGLAMLAVLTVVLIYIFLVIPANSELARNKAELSRLETERMAAEGKYGRITDTQAHVATLMTSVDNFEADNLPVATSGRAALYQRLNSLILAHGLVNTSGPDYTPLELADQTSGVETEEERGRAKYRSLFPGIYVTMTVDGSYQNLRRFIREIETGGQFVIVSAVELEPSDVEKSGDSQAPIAAGPPAAQPGMNPNANPNAGSRPPGFSNFGPMTSAPVQQQAQKQPKGKMHGEVVSLRLEMAAYFRRAGVPQPVDAPVQQ
ncbi:MAG TPA: hypothetical protein VNA22_04015 [Pyrinomonadaceae bacterium]|nr:hypothetical protein [Pyrinomonadaceae bacterium]